MQREEAKGTGLLAFRGTHMHHVGPADHFSKHPVYFMYLCLPVPPTAFGMGVHHTVNPVHTVSPILKPFTLITAFHPEYLSKKTPLPAA
jgi:hypothetical protein